MSDTRRHCLFEIKFSQVDRREAEIYCFKNVGFYIGLYGQAVDEDGPCNLSVLFGQYRHLQTMYLRKFNPYEYFERKKTLVARQITEILHIGTTKIVKKS